MDSLAFLPVAAAGFLLAWLLGRGLRRATAAERDRAVAAEAAASRIARMWAAELRAATMTLQGHLEQCAAGCGEQRALGGLGAVLRQLVGLADDLQDQIAPADPPRLHEEQVPLEPAMRDAIAAVVSSLAPGQRQWRQAPALAGCTLSVDRRALAEVLQRVLGNAARHSRAGDWIEIGLETGADGIVLTIEDEGTGLGTPDRPAPPGQPESRSLGLGLALARRLMEAHGGALETQAVARVGTRVSLRFPAERVIAVAAPADACAA